MKTTQMPVLLIESYQGTRPAFSVPYPLITSFAGSLYVYVGHLNISQSPQNSVLIPDFCMHSQIKSLWESYGSW